MGHRQQMSDAERSKWDSMQYKAALDAKRGHNHSYMTDKIYAQLQKQGYSIYRFKTTSTFISEQSAIEKRNELRGQGHYARIISTANRLRIRDYELYFKGRLILDPDADGTQWLYRAMGISEQRHPELVRYACYDWNKNSHLIGVAHTKKECKELINNYILSLNCQCPEPKTHNEIKIDICTVCNKEILP